MSHKNNKKPLFEFFTEAMGWLQIVASPLLPGLIIGFFIYFSEPNNTRLFIGIAVTVIGLIAGIIWDTRVWKKQGTMHFISRVSATPELNGNNSNKLSLSLSIKEFIDKYKAKQGSVKGGSLCFYGHWFGKPHDNYHQLESIAFDDVTNILTLSFNEKETLSISNPQQIIEFENKLHITNADNVHWEWYSYGKPYTKENLYFIDINKQHNTLTGKTNWQPPEFKGLNIKKPALLWS